MQDPLRLHVLGSLPRAVHFSGYRGPKQLSAFSDVPAQHHTVVEQQQGAAEKTGLLDDAHIRQWASQAHSAHGALHSYLKVKASLRVTRDV